MVLHERKMMLTQKLLKCWRFRSFCQGFRLQLLKLDDLFRGGSAFSNHLNQVKTVGQVAYVDGFLVIAVGALA